MRKYDGRRSLRDCLTPGFKMAVQALAHLLVALLFVGLSHTTVFAAQTVAASAPQLPPGKHALILDGYSHGVKIPDAYLSGLLEVLKNSGMELHHIHVEHLGLDRHTSKEYRQQQAAFLHKKYSGAKIDLVFCLFQPSLNLLLNDLPDMAPGAPVLSWNARLPAGTLPGSRHFVMQTPKLDFRGTMQLAEKLFPKTERVIVIQGHGEVELARKEAIRNDLAPWQGRLQIEDTFALSAEETEAKLAAAPKNTIILGVPLSKDAKGETFVGVEFMQRMLKTAQAPYFVLYDVHIGTGTIGGMVSKGREDAMLLAGKGVDILRGATRLTEPVTTIPAVSVPMFDWQQLERWGAKSSALPADTVFLNRPHTLWEQHKAGVIATLTALLTLASLVAGLSILTHRLKQATDAALESETRFRVMVERAPEAIVVYDVDLKRIVDVNTKTEQLLGCSREKLLQGGPERFYPTQQPNNQDVATSLADHIARALKGEEVVLERAIHSDDGRDLLCEVRLTQLPDREHRLVRASYIDITERKRVTEQLQASETRYRNLVENAPIGVYRRHLDGTYLYVNPCLAREFNCADAAEFIERYGSTEKRWAHPEKHAEFKELLLKNGKIFNYEVESLLVDGRKIWTSLSCVLDAATNVIDGWALNITERKQADEELQAHLKDVESFSRLAVGREHRIIELKQRINELCRAQGQEAPYPATEEPPTGDAELVPPSPAAEVDKSTSPALPDYKLAKLLDLDSMQTLLNSFCDAVGIASAIIDLEGQVFVGARWQRICTDFHRVNAQTCAKCIESDTILSTHLREGQHFSMYTCRNGLTDAASPIIIEGRHVANVFVGQFLLAPPDEVFFRKQCIEYGFDKDAYFEALRQVPIIPQERLPGILGFLTSCSSLVARMGLNTIRGRISEEKLARQAGELKSVISKLRQQQQAAVNLAEDATEARVEAEQVRESLRESEEKLRAILEVSPLPIAWTDANGCIEFWNRKARELFGYAPEQVATVEKWFARAYPDPQYRHDVSARWNAAIAEALAADGELTPGEYEITCLDGTVRTVEIFGFVSSERVVVIFNDITSRKQAEEEREKLESQLRQTQKMEAIGTLAGGIAHDFNNILSIIFGYNFLAMQETDPEKRQLHLNELQKGAVRAKELVAQILAFSRKTEQVKQPLQVSLIVKEALKMLRASIPTTIEIKQNIASTGLVLADPTQIHQIVMNLCTNSYHAMRETGGILAVSLEEVTIGAEDYAFDDVAPGRYLKLEVSDTGCGIEPKILEKIFEPYFTTKKPGEGTGLGLAVVHGIVKSHHGRIGVYSEVGNGTSFHVYLPLTEQAPVALPDSTPPQELKGNGERVLLVDDEAQIRAIGDAILAKNGYQVTTCGDGLQAWEAFQKDSAQFDLVITDMTMPVMTGAELAQNILALRPQTPVILCTGQSELINKEKAVALGICEYLKKPILAEALLGAAKKALEKR